MNIRIRESSSFGTEFFWQSVENNPASLFCCRDIAFRIRMTILFSCSTNELEFITFFTKLSIFFFKYSFTPYIVTPLFSSSGAALRMYSVKRARWGEYVTLFLSRSLSYSFSNALASKSIPLTYVCLVCVITLSEQTAFHLLTSFCRDTFQLDSLSILWLYLFTKSL